MNRQAKKEGSIILVGPAGSGKTALGDRLAVILGIPVYPAGEKFRRECKIMGIEIAKLSEVSQERVLTLDRQTDNYMKEVIGQRLIITARTAAMFANKMTEEHKISRHDYTAVGINAPYPTRAKRKHDSMVRESKTETDKHNIKSPKVLENEFRERDEDDLTRLRFLYRREYGLRGWDGLFGVPPCDLVLNSERMTIDQEVQQVLALLGFVDNVIREI